MIQNYKRTQSSFHNTHESVSFSSTITVHSHAQAAASSVMQERQRLLPLLPPPLSSGYFQEQYIILSSKWSGGMETPTLLRHTHHGCIKLGTSFLRRGKGNCASAVSFWKKVEGGEVRSHGSLPRPSTLSANKNQHVLCLSHSPSPDVRLVKGR